MHTRSKGIIISYLKIAINMVSGVILSSVLLRMLGDTEYGIYQTVAAFANSLILLEFGVGTVMVRNISMCRGRGASREEIQRNITTNWTLTGMLSLLLLVVSVMFYCAIPGIYAKSMTAEQIRHGQEIFAFSVVHLLTTFLIHTVNSVVLSFDNYTFGSLQSIFRTLGRTVLLVALMMWLPNALVIAIVDAALGILCLAGAFWYCRKKLKVKLRFGKCDPAILRAAAPLALAVFMQGIVNQANNNVAKVIVGVVLSPESVSLYAVALYIYSVFASLTNVASAMYVPGVTQSVGKGLEGKELAKELVTPCRLTALTGGMILFGFIAVGKQFVQILYGQEYLLAWPMAVIIMTPAYVDTVVDVLVHVLNAVNKRMMRSVVLVITTALNILLTIICLNYWGVMGAAVSTAVCTLLGPVLIMNIFYKKVIKMPMLWLYRQAFRGILLYLALGCVAALAVGQLISGTLISFIVSGGVFVAIALGGYLCFGMAKSEKQQLLRIVHRHSR